MADFVQEVIARLNLDASGYFAGMRAASDAAKQTGATTESVQKAIQDAVKASTKEVEIFTRESIEMAQAQGATKTALDNDAKALTNFKGRTREAILETQVFGRSLGEWKESLTQTKTLLGGTSSATGVLSGALRVLKIALASVGIGLIITAVAALLGYFARFQGGIDRLSRALAGLTGAMDVVIGRVVAFGVGLKSIFTGDFSKGFDEIKASVSGLGSALVDAATNAAALEGRLQTLRDNRINAIVVDAKQVAQLERLKDLAQDETRSLKERAGAVRAAGQVQEALAGRRLSFLREELAIIRQQNQEKEKAGPITSADREAEANAEKAVIEEAAKIDATRRDLAKELREIGKQGAEERRKAAEQERKDLEALAKTLERLRVEVQVEGIDQELAAVNKKYDDLQKAAADGIEKLKAIEKRRGLTPEELAQRDELISFEEQLEQRRYEALLAVILDYQTKRTELEAKLAEAERKSAEDRLKVQQEIDNLDIDLIEQNGKQYIASLKARGAGKAEIALAEQRFDYLVNRRRLEAQIAFEQGMLALIDASDTKAIEAAKARIKAAQAALKTVEAEASIPIEEDKKKPKNLLEELGFTDEQAKAIEEFGQRVVGVFQQITAARVQAAEEAVRIANTEVDQAQTALDAEIAIAETGAASYIALRRQQYDEAKAQQAKALEEQRKAQKAQAALDTALQFSSLVTASAGLFKSLAPLPFGLGVPAAIALTAVMFAAFAKAKIDAAKASRFREGGEALVDHRGISRGRSHEQGGNLIETEKGEFTALSPDGKRINVVKKRMSEKYFPVLTALNEDDAPKAWSQLAQLSGARAFTGPRLDYRKADVSHVGAEKKEAGERRSKEELKELRTMNRTLRAQLKEQKRPAQTTTLNPDGSRTIQHGNRTRIIR